MTPLPALALASLLSAEPPPSAATPQVIAIVRIPIPWWAPRFLVRRRMVAAVPEYAAAPGLLRKAFTLGEDGSFGGVYLWRSQADAEAWFDARWHARVKQRYGADVSPALLEVSADLPGPAAPRGPDLGGGAVGGGARVVLLDAAPGARPDPARLAAALGADLVRLTLGRAGDRVTAVAVFASAAAGRSALVDGHDAVAASLGGTFSSTGLEAPVLLRYAP